jgi:hypothetical protein
MPQRKQTFLFFFLLKDISQRGHNWGIMFNCFMWVYFNFKEIIYLENRRNVSVCYEVTGIFFFFHKFSDISNVSKAERDTSSITYREFICHKLIQCSAQYKQIAIQVIDNTIFPGVIKNAIKETSVTTWCKGYMIQVEWLWRKGVRWTSSTSRLYCLCLVCRSQEITWHVTQLSTHIHTHQ